MSRHGPPRWAQWVVRAVLDGTERDCVLGDLEEEFAVRQETSGRARAVSWYVLEVTRSVGPLMSYSVAGRGEIMAGLDQDVRGALRLFRRSPGFAAVVVATLAIGVGGAAAVYSVVRGVILSPLPFEDSERVVMLWGQTPQYPRAPLTVGDHNELRRVDAFALVAASWGNTALILGEAEPEQVGVGWVTPEYLPALGIDAQLGRRLDAGEQDAVVISHDLWVRRYGADAAVLERMLNLSGETFRIVGVLPANVDPNLSAFSGRHTDYEVWRLQPPEWTLGDDRSVGWLRATARLRDGVTLAQAQDEVDALMVRVNETVTERDGGTELRVNLVPVRTDLVSGVSRTLWILLGAVFGVLLIAATNVAHLMLGRGELRGGEVAVRAALGGSRWRLVRQLCVESATLALVGGVVGLGVAWIGVDALVALAPPTLPRLHLVELSGSVFAIAFGATCLAAAVFGIVPALRATRVDLTQSLGERAATAGRGRQRLSRTLVVAQVALSLALVTGTGLLVRSMSGLRTVDLGFETQGIVTFALEAPAWGNTAEEAGATMAAYLDRLGAVPGVTAVGFTNRVPLAGGLFTGTYRSAEMVAADADAVEVSVRYVSPEYLGAMGARLVTGRTFRPDDGSDVLLIDQLVAERTWPGTNPVGRRVMTSAVGEDEAWAEVVGVVAPMKHAGVAAAAAETIFLPMLASAHNQNFRYVAVRVSGEPLAYLDPLRMAAREVDANAVMARPRTMNDLFEADVAGTRFATMLLSMFGLVALVLAVIGLHGVMAFSVRRRVREMGIRLALGAEQRDMLTGAMASGAMLVGTGVCVGLILSLGVGSVLGSLLFGVQPTDVPTLVGSALVIMVVGLVGAYLPARLVLRVDPVVALRQE